MSRMNSASASIRMIWAAAFSLLLALRIFASSGLMPALDGGQLTVIACPDAELNAPLTIGAGAHHHHGKTAHQHPPCPFAAASWLSFVGNDPAPPLPIAIMAVALPAPIGIAAWLGRRSYERPPLRGPPLPA